LQLKPTTQHGVIVKEVANLLENFSYKRVPMNDSISNIIYNNLVEGLDQGRNYLLQSDIEDFQQFKASFAQDFKAGDLSSAFYVCNNYSGRCLQCLNYALQQVDQQHDFTTEEEYSSYREKLPWFNSEAELQEQWRKRVKYALLNLKLSTGDSAKYDPEKNKETLRSRYQNLISQASKEIGRASCRDAV